MDDMILSPIKLSDMLAQVRTLIREELEASGIAIHKDPEIIDRAELCKRLNITPPTARLWESKGKLPVIKLGSNIRYNWTAVVEALERKKGSK